MFYLHIEAGFLTPVSGLNSVGRCCLCKLDSCRLLGAEINIHKCVDGLASQVFTLHTQVSLDVLKNLIAILNSITAFTSKTVKEDGN